MDETYLPFARPHISNAAIKEVISCLKSGWLTTGPRVEQFTQKLKSYFNAPYVIPLSSATAGLHLTLLALNLQPGDEVITTPLTFAATLNTIVLAGGKPVLVDIDLKTLNMDVNRIEDAITPRTRAIIPVHFAGRPLDMDPLLQIAQQFKLRVIEDAAHAMGTLYKDKRIGSFGDTQIFSFHPNKNMTTGEGGCVVTRDDALAERISLLSFHGTRKKTNGDYDIICPGYKYNMMDLQAAIGLHQLNDLESFIKRRITLAARYQTVLKDWSAWKLPSGFQFSCRHTWHLYTPLLNTDSTHITRDEFVRHMQEHKIGVGMHYKAAHLHPYYRERFGLNNTEFPQAEWASARIVSLPLFPTLQDQDFNRILDVMYKIFYK